MTKLFDTLTPDNWHLLIGILFLVLLGRIGAWILEGKSDSTRFPRLVALIDLVVLPCAILVVGSLVQLVVGLLEIPRAGDGIRVLTQLLVYLSAGWALARLIEVTLLDRAIASKY